MTPDSSRPVPRICIPIADPDVVTIRKRLAELPAEVDFIELRLDMVERPSRSTLTELSSLSDQRTILTCRSAAEGGHFPGSEPERIDLLRAAVELGFAYVDVELHTLETSPVLARPGTRLIVSYHDFTATPSYQELCVIADRAAAFPDAIVKIATAAQSAEDTRTLMRLLTDRAGETDMIVIGMGQAGVITRIAAPLLGAFLTFAAAPDGGTAPGQLPYPILRRIYSDMHIIPNS